MGLVKYLIAILLILIPATSLADTHNAASCKVADVTTAIAASANGDTVTIPTCEGTDGTWTSGVTLSSTKILTIQGAGLSNTVITVNSGGGITMTGAHRITGISLTAASGNIVMTVRGTGFRIDHCRFTSNGAEAISFYDMATTGALAEGLVDNNDFVSARSVVWGSSGGFANRGTRWAEAPLLGTEKQVIFEDNTFYKVGGNIIDSGYGGVYTARYNTITGSTEFMVHGLQSDNNRGSKNWEMYGNKFTSSPTVFAATWVRSGTGILAANQFSGYSYDIIFDDNRAHGQCAGTCTVVGYCDGTSVIDGNSDATGYRCRDQVGTGQDTVAWTVLASTPGSTPTLSPAYLFMNRKSTGNTVPYIHNGDGDTIIADRDYYTTTSTTSTDCPANSGGSCTKGVGCGTLANRPGTCTAGVGYWATSQNNCSDLTGYVGDSTQRTSGISTYLQGTLYKCNAEGTWDSYYTPYTYPHPLREDAGTDETAPTLVSATINAAGTGLYLIFTEPVTVNTNTGFVLTATGSPTLTYASGAGTTTLVYTISAAVQQSESGITLAYTTGANYIEDAAGNDLGSFTGTAVTNNSTQNTPPTVELTVTKTGTGCTITSAPSGVNCGSTCTLSVDSGTVVTLSGWSENGWNAITYGGDCAANGTVTMNADKECRATCTQVYLFP